MERSNLCDQACDFITRAMAEGRWPGGLPSERRLADELKIARMTLRRALARLESDGALTRASGSRRRVYVAPAATRSGRARRLRVGVLVPASVRAESDILFQNRMMLSRELEAAGHLALPVYHDNGNGPLRARRLAAQVDAVAADAWVVIGGTRDMLDWFEARPAPVIRYGEPETGYRRMAFSGYRAATGLVAAGRRLLELGHSRIVLLAPRRFREGRLRDTLPGYAALLDGAGIPCDGYHIPEWDVSPAGLAKVLGSLFRLTPPTALIVWNGEFAAGVMAFLAKRGLRVPEAVSLVVLEYSEKLAWAEPGMRFAHVDFDRRRSSKNIVRWLDKVASGSPCSRSYGFEGRFVDGASVAKPPRAAR